MQIVAPLHTSCHADQHMEAHQWRLVKDGRGSSGGGDLRWVQPNCAGFLHTRPRGEKLRPPLLANATGEEPDRWACDRASLHPSSKFMSMHVAHKHGTSDYWQPLALAFCDLISSLLGSSHDPRSTGLANLAPFDIRTQVVIR